MRRLVCPWLPITREIQCKANLRRWRSSSGRRKPSFSRWDSPPTRSTCRRSSTPCVLYYSVHFLSFNKKTSSPSMWRDSTRNLLYSTLIGRSLLINYRNSREHPVTHDYHNSIQLRVILNMRTSCSSERTLTCCGLIRSTRLTVIGIAGATEQTDSRNMC